MSNFETAFAALEAQIGESPAVSQWHKIDQSRINQFADVTEDWQFIHLDKTRVQAETPFDTTIAHGFLTLSMASRFYYDAIDEPEGMRLSLNYGFEKIRFIQPVMSGANIRGVFKLREVTRRGAASVMTRHEMTVEIQENKRPALVAEWLTLLEF